MPYVNGWYCRTCKKLTEHDSRNNCKECETPLRYVTHRKRISQMITFLISPVLRRCSCGYFNSSPNPTRCNRCHAPLNQAKEM